MWINCWFNRINGFSIYNSSSTVFIRLYITNNVLGLSGLFGSNNKKNIFIGCLLAVILKNIAHILSGCIYFGEYAWEGWNPLAYSIVYNLSGTGLEGLLSVIVLTTMPLAKIKKMANIQTTKKASL